MGLLGILIGLLLLVWLAFRGWSVLVLAPAAAMVAAAFGGQPLLANWTANLHGQRRGIFGAILSAVPARRRIRQAHGGFRLGHRHRKLYDRQARQEPGDARGGACRRCCHLRRRQPVRRLLCARPDGADAVPRRQESPAG
jgi:hypothetical protein